MKKLFVLFFAALIGVSLFSMNVTADSTRTISRKSGVAVSDPAVIVANGGTLYHISGFADTGNCVYSVHDASSRNIDTPTTQATTSNVIAEGGEATQYDSFPTVDFGKEGIRFNNGLIVETSLCTVVLSYE